MSEGLMIADLGKCSGNAYEFNDSSGNTLVKRATMKCPDCETKVTLLNCL